MKSNEGKTFCMFSGKGGVGKTILALSLSGVYEAIGKKVLIIDFDLTSGSIALDLNKPFEKTIYHFMDDYSNHRFKSLEDYVIHYDSFIDVLPSPKDPRQASKIETKYIDILLTKAKQDYAIIIMDMSHVLNEFNLTILDETDEIVFVMNNDPMDLKNVKNILTIFHELNKENYCIVLNNSKDPMKKYFTDFDIKNIIKSNIDYTISNEFYIRNIDNYIMNGQIVTLQPKAPSVFNKDYATMTKLCIHLLESKEEVNHDEE